MADMSRPVGERVRNVLPAALMIGALGEGLADDGGVLHAQQKTAISPGLVQCAQGERDAEGALPPPPIKMLEGHNSVGLNTRKLPGNLGKLVNVATFASFRDPLGNLHRGRTIPSGGSK